MKWNSIRTKLIVFMILATVIPTIISMIVSYSVTTQSLKESAVSENINLLYQGRMNLLNNLEALNRSSLIVYSDPDFFRSLNFGYEYIPASGRQTSTLQNIKNTSSDIAQVYLYVNKKKQATLVAQDTPKKGSDRELYAGIPSLVDRDVFLDPPHMIHKYGFDTVTSYEPERQVFTLYRTIERVPSTEQIGLLAIDVDMEFFARIGDQLYQPAHEQLYLINDQGIVMYSGNAELIGQPLQTSWYSNLKESSNTKGHFEQNNQIYIHESIQSSFGNLTLIKEIPSSYLLRSANKAALINSLLLAFSLIIIIAATILISVNITAPIKQLVRYMNQVKTGHMAIDIQSNRNDEIGILYKRFRSMIDTINNLILQEYKLKLANSTNQLRALQAQVNPHFMNNALQTIGTLALEHNMKRIYSLISALARMMRYTMHNTDKPVKLETELQHIKDYIELQKERFENQFDIQYDIEPSTLQILIPKMIIQPLIENYFKHGMNTLSSDNKVFIRSRWLSASVVQITVEDNGNGMPYADWSLLQQRLQLSDPLHIDWFEESGNEEQSLSDGIGLVNIMIRLKLYYHGNAQFNVENILPHGFRVVLTMNVEGEPDESSYSR